MVAEQGMTRSSRPGIGCTVKRTLGFADGPKVSMSKACSAEVRAPVSILAFSAGTPRSGSEIHSSQPNCSGWGGVSSVMARPPCHGRGFVGYVSAVSQDPSMSASFNYSLLATDGSARAGRIVTPRGEIDTPAFMPVGTAGTVKGMLPGSVAATGAQIVLGNTYHLMLRPGAERVARLGGLHRFMNWQGPILTDSGGFQVMSLAGLRKLTERGVTFRSHVDGSRHDLSPERSMEIQRLLGSDIVMAFDECPALPADRDRIAESMRLSMRWAARSKAAFGERPGHALFGI